ncbi:MAG: hypothetical protein IH973_14270, partial [Myxococcales bacterium]|nr:hypothetical protein [Myxococcales bacterium]
MPAAKVTMPAKFSARNAGLVLLVMLASCNAGDVGNQRNKAPLAVATAVGAGVETGGRFQVRSGTEVLISGKDSDSDDAPILEFAWSQLSGDSVVLFERTTVARSFTAPSGPTTLVFELEVTNALGTTSTDIVTIDVIAVSDVNKFLRDPGVNEQFYLFVSPTTTAGSMFGSTIPYSLSVTPTVYWTDRGGSLQSQTLAPILTASDQLDAEFVVPASPVDSTQKRIAVPVPLLDVDEVNKFYQDASRAARLELEEVANATVDLQVELLLTGSGSFEVFVGRRSGASYVLIDGADLLMAGATANGGILAGTSDSVLIDLETLRQELLIESSLSASNYYDCIDPMGGAATLDGWLTSVFDLADGSIASAQYTNNYDLGFARDMFLRQHSDGSVYTFVINHPSLEQLINGVGEFATVVMEYSAAPTGNCGDEKFSSTEKIVKFYAYVPDVTTGEMVRAESMNFDGRGERFLPGVCTACHDGDVGNIAAFGAASLSSIAASNADLSATFMPWDIDSLLFADAADPSLIDPSLNPSEFTAAQLAAASLEGQQAALRALNEGALRTYSDLDDLDRYEEPLRLIHGWYGNESAIAGPLSAVPTNVLTNLPAVEFDGTYVQAGWLGEETIYFDIYTRYCRMCHTQQNNLSANFDSHAEFIAATSRITSFVFEQGVMPAARLTLDRFWVDFAGGSTPAAEMLRDHLNAVAGAGIASDVIPGRPVAVVQVTPASVSDIDLSGNLVATTINLDGSTSLFADSFLW